MSDSDTHTARKRAALMRDLQACLGECRLTRPDRLLTADLERLARYLGIDDAVKTKDVRCGCSHG